MKKCHLLCWLAVTLLAAPQFSFADDDLENKAFDEVNSNTQHKTVDIGNLSEQLKPCFDRGSAGCTEIEIKNNSKFTNFKKEGSDFVEENMYKGTNAFQWCQKQASRPWDAIVRDSPGGIVDSFIPSWQTLRKDKYKIINDNLIGDPSSNSTSNLNGLIAKRNELQAKVKSPKCKEGDSDCDQALKQLVKTVRDLKSKSKQIVDAIQEMKKEGYVQQKKLEQCMGAAAAMDYVDYNDPVAKNSKIGDSKTFDQKVICTTQGAETQDYPACKKVVDLYNASQVGEKAMNTTQEIITTDSNNKMMMQTIKDPNNPTNGLEVQLKATKNERNIADQRVVFQGAKAGILVALIEGVPTSDDLHKKCVQKMQNVEGGGIDKNYILFRDDLKDIQDQIDSNHAKTLKDPSSQLKAQASICTRAIYQSEMRLVDNQKAREDAIGAAVDAGVTMLGYAGK
ncbi:MAG: hypothetical protein WCG27_12410, partial [Pseudomonadota bacterium]